MALSNYTELRASVARSIKRSDMSDDIVDWIHMFEKEMSTILRRREMSNRATTPTVVSQATYELPADFGDAISMHLNTTERVVTLEPSDWDRIATEFSEEGEPREWAITNNEFILGPTPDAVYTLELYYYRGIQPLATATTNWLLTANPRLYLFGTLAQAAATTDDPQGAAWVSAYQDALRVLKRDQVKERGFGGGPILRANIFGGGGGDILSGE